MSKIRTAAAAALLVALTATGCPAPETPTDVTPGAYCDTEGKQGQTDKGTPMKCTRTAGEDRPRWRAP